MNTEIFQQLGLEQRETKIYLDLIRSGPSKAGNIAKRTQIDRSVTYKMLDKLISKGFASFVIRENRRYFQGVNPNRLMDLLKEREQRLEEIIPHLNKMEKPVEQTQVEIYKGKEGFKIVMNALLKPKKTLFGFGYTAKSPEILKYWYNGWQKRRIKAKIRRKYLVTQAIANKPATKQPHTTIKVMPQGFYFPSSTIITENIVLIFFPETKDFTGIIIRNKNIAKSYKSFFEVLWKLSKSKTYTY